MSKKFIPNGDFDFVTMAEQFARTISKQQEVYRVSREDSEALMFAVSRFRQALDEARSGAKSETKTQAKEIARLEAEGHIRRLAHIIRATKSIDPVAKVNLGLHERTKKSKQLTCPNEPPSLRFIEAKHRNTSNPIHVLSFCAEDSKTRPAGATRLELFVMLVPPEKKVTGSAIRNLNARPWYLRSYTRSPIQLTPPMANVPMRVVYFARWADSLGNVGPFSAPAAGWVEGGLHMPALPNVPGSDVSGHSIDPMSIDRTPFEDEQERIYWVAIGTAQLASLHQANPLHHGSGLMLEESEKRLLEGPGRDAA